MYAIIGSGAAAVGNLKVEDRIRLTSWICDQHQFGVREPVITSYVVDQAKARRLLTISQRLSRGLLFLGRYLRLGDTFILPPSDFADNAPFATHLAAETECESKQQLESLLILYEQQHYLERARHDQRGVEFRVTAHGWLRIDELSTTLPSSSQAFVAMWFDGSMHDAYLNGFKPGILDCGYKPLRIDRKEHANKIDDEIIAEIRRSRFLVADFTCGPDGARGGVYYEAGFARGLGLPVIWTCRSDVIKLLHFDTRQYSHIVWDTTQDLRDKLSSRIGAVLGDGPYK